MIAQHGRSVLRVCELRVCECASHTHTIANPYIFREKAFLLRNSTFNYEMMSCHHKRTERMKETNETQCTLRRKTKRNRKINKRIQDSPVGSLWGRYAYFSWFCLRSNYTIFIRFSMRVIAGVSVRVWKLICRIHLKLEIIEINGKMLVRCSAASVSISPSFSLWNSAENSAEGTKWSN